ncbi:hypothetical protein [Mycoplasma suis]|uniref:Uncharacterized protein n=1 Tax=Mycoplasma suis (strain Illinois) TaxID=768700 RepID=F0QQG5_MYCSL|nr:hypothetical protein [Mycoplasma suis]ADX97735.1 hypothetical protein MSU_0191 [Mycoplasma suis str. Illinois]
MELALFSKLLVTFSTLGGTVVGGYFASNSSLMGENINSQIIKKPSEDGQSVGAENESSHKTQDQNNRTENKASVSGNETSNPEAQQTSQHSLTDTSTGLDSEGQEPRVPSVSDTLVPASQTNTQNDNTNWLDRNSNSDSSDDGTDWYRDDGGEETSPEEESEHFDEFDEDDYPREEDEEERSSSPIVATYISGVNVGEDSSIEGPICDQWFFERSENKKRTTGEECKSSYQGRNWSRKSGTSDPSVWLSVNENYAGRILKHYGLFEKGKTKYEKNNSRWKTGSWWCDRERASENSNDLLVMCDYYPERQQTGS